MDLSYWNTFKRQKYDAIADMLELIEQLEINSKWKHAKMFANAMEKISSPHRYERNEHIFMNPKMSFEELTGW